MGNTSAALTELVQSGWGNLNVERIVGSTVLLIICLVVVRLLMRLVDKTARRKLTDKRVQQFTVRGIRTALYLLTVLIVAGSIGIDVTSLIALASVLGLAVSLAVQDTLSNIAGGMVMLFAKPFVLGDYIETSDGEGTVAEIGLTHTKLDTYSGQRLMLPNSKMSAGKIVNYTVLGVRRIDHAIQTSYDCDPAAVKASCLKAVSRTAHVLDDPAPQAVITAFGESAVEYHVRFWAKTEDYWDANFAVLDEIRRAFGEDGITMTYNHLNVHIMDEKNAKEK